MLIWQTYFRKPMTDLCNNIIGTAIKSGIYKITNIKTKECYIGQAVDLTSRWKDHAKAGLGIDTPAANKLYKAIQEYGIWNFSWEILEECERSELNEKEKYYIELYQSKEYGYNSIKGNSK
jgi:group I intron endonuclease